MGKNVKQKIRRGGSGSGLFLIELMIAILFFSLASAVCMQLFARAHLVARESRNLGEAVNRAQAAAEYFKAADGSAERLAELLDAPRGDDGTIVVWYGAGWERAEGADGAYRLTVEPLQEENGVPAVRVAVEDMRAAGEDGPIFSLVAAKHPSSK